jgi:hypothetical protein
MISGLVSEEEHMNDKNHGRRRFLQIMQVFRNLIFATLVFPVASWGTCPQAGTWKLNPEQSKFRRDVPAQKSETMNVQEQEGGLKFTADQVDAQGKPVHVEFNPKYDGKDYPMIGSPVSDTIAMRRINASTLESVRKKDGKVVRTVRSVVSKDGKTWTNTWKSKNAKGEPITWLTVFDKQ